MGVGIGLDGIFEVLVMWFFVLFTISLLISSWIRRLPGYRVAIESCYITSMQSLFGRDRITHKPNGLSKIGAENWQTRP